MKIAFCASAKPDAKVALETLSKRYGNATPEEADVIAAIGGDGYMLEALKNFMHLEKPIYGVNRGTVGFLMNDMPDNDLVDQIKRAEQAIIHPLEMRATTMMGEMETAIAINEVSLFRETRQTARISIKVNGRERMEQLICDGILVSTPAGSTAYNLSAHGPILPIGSQLLALTPISAFRPRRWRGALLPHDAVVTLEVQQPEFRPVSAVADNYEVRHVKSVEICERADQKMYLLHNPGHSLDERIILEQFTC